MGKDANIYAFCNQKGGVGKTTTVINTSTCLAKLGFKTLVVDLDPQGNASSGFGLDKNQIETTIYDVLINDVPARSALIRDAFPKLDIIGSNANLAGAEIEIIALEQREYLLRGKLNELRDEYDFIFIDCPPSLGLLTINAFVAANRLMIPLQCEYYALEGLGQLISTYELVRERLNQELDIFGVILTMADFRTNLTEQVINEVRDFFKAKVFQTIISRSIKLSEAPGFGKPAVVYAPTARGSFEYQSLAEEILDRLGVSYSYAEKENGAENSDEKAKEEDTPEGVGEEKIAEGSA